MTSPAGANVGGTRQLLPGNFSGIACPPLANAVQALQTSQLAAALPPMVAESVGQLLRQVSRPGQVSHPEGLPASDAEASLDMKRELESGLGRITLHQLNLRPSDTQSPKHWQLEIPLQLAGSLHSLRMEIDREPAGGDSNAQNSRKACSQ